MTITEIKSEFVFAQMQKGLEVICIDFKKGQYISCNDQTVASVQRMIDSGTCKFFATSEGK